MTAYITRSRVMGMTAVAALLYVALVTAFDGGTFTRDLWVPGTFGDSGIFLWLFLGIIVTTGWMQASQVAGGGVAVRTRQHVAMAREIDNPARVRLLLNSPHFGILWMPIRFFVGWQWIGSAEEKLRADGWMRGGSALAGFWQNAVAIPDEGRPAITYGWYRGFLRYMLDHGWYTWFAKVVAFGELLVGFGLLVGALTGIAAFFGITLNLNFMLAGSASSNPIMLILGVLLLLGWKVAGAFGLDRYLLPLLGTPWQRGTLFSRRVADRPHRVAVPVR